MSDSAIVSPEQMRALEIDRSIAFGEHGLEVTTLEQVGRFATWAMKSGLVKAKIPAEVVVAIQIGSELGFSLMRSIHVVHIINGTPSIAVEAQVAKVESDGALTPGTKIMHSFSGKGDERACVVWSFPKGGQKIESEPVYFKDFKHLHNKDNWKHYPDRMLKARAVGFHVRDFYSRCTNNLPSSEEAMDYEMQRGERPVERDVTPPREPDPLLRPVAVNPAPEPEQTEIFDCTHPHGFAATVDSDGVRVCIECGQTEDE